jgi:hypothetical protein
VEEQFELQNLKSFDLVTQELYRFHPATIFTNKSHARKTESLDAEDKLEPKCLCEQATAITTARWSLSQLPVHENCPKPREPVKESRQRTRHAD